jgi:Putative metallopeptidase
MIHDRRAAIGAAISLMLIGSGAAFAQPTPAADPAPPAQSAPPAPTTFHERVEELARALQDNPRLKNLSEQQRLNRLDFVMGNTLFALLHEMGHVAIDEMKLPVLGREEDEADTFATLRLLKIGSDFSQRVLAEAAKNWFLSARRDQETGSEPVYYGEHSMSQERAYQVVCLMVGSDPAKFKSLADEAQMPPERQETCRKDYGKISRSWDAVLELHRRAPDQPLTRIYVVYDNAPENLAGFARGFRAVRILETVAQRSAADFAWPAPFTMEMRSCGRPDAAWSEENRTLRMCYELAFDFAQLYEA